MYIRNGRQGSARRESVGSRSNGDMPVDHPAHGPLSLNEAWVRCIVDAISASGVRRAVLCPGGRATVMCLALDADERIVQTVVSTDERSGAFVALGIAKASAEPVAIVTTSGSAVANLLPALTEAHACHVPLVVLSCDRPRHLRGAGFGQMLDHIGACRAFVYGHLDLPDPSGDAGVIAALHDALSKTLAFCKAGPVHINLPLAGTYDAAESTSAANASPGSARAGNVSPGNVSPENVSPENVSAEVAVHALMPDARAVAQREAAMIGRVALTQADAAALVARVLDGRDVHNGLLRALVVVGPDPELSPDAILAFGRCTGFPVLADAGSGLRAASSDRFSSDTQDPSSAAHDVLVVGGFDVLAPNSALNGQRPDLIVRFGHAPVLPAVQAYLAAHPCPTIKIAREACERDYLHPTLAACNVLVAPSVADLAALANALIDRARQARGDALTTSCVDSVWRGDWCAVGARHAHLRRAALDAMPWGEAVAAREIFRALGFAFIHIGNSMPLRHADIVCETRVQAQTVYVNRGVAGIDGTLSTFLGEAFARRDAGLLVIGDQAFLHDLSALSTAQRIGTPACVCVINNRGGAIFDFLPVAASPAYERTIRNPYQMDIGALARGFGLHHARTDCLADLRRALDASKEHAGVSIVEVDVPVHSACAQLHALTRSLASGAA
jgi:2-succinyl-5-enolpyruvyl-6-hydroxy-3-cyclohexene-1-carboxylate synthase